MLFVSAGVAALLAILLFGFGGVSGTEFSPTHFETRSFRFFEVPWLHIQISPIRRATSQSPTSRFLANKSMIHASRGTATTWHLVTLTRGPLGTTEADAKLLTDQLELYVHHKTNQSDHHWVQWSKNESAKAKVLWPVVQKLAMRELYVLIPRLFTLALDSPDENALQISIDDYLQSNYREFISEMRDAGRPELAAELLREAIADYPNDAKLRAMR